MGRENSSTDGTTEVSNPFHPSLVRQMLQASRLSGNNADRSSNDNQRITNEALVAAGEVLRLFVQEAWHRASIEAECEYEGFVEDTTNDQCDTSNNVSAIGNRTKTTTIAPIRPDHITKIAAELLMDFS
jgi:CENP-S associating Centromere protein X